MRVSPCRFTLLCLWPAHLFNPGLICNFLQGTRKPSEATLLSRPDSGQNQIYPQERTGKRRLLPGGPCSSEGS